MRTPMRKVYTIHSNRPQDKSMSPRLLQERAGTFPAWEGDNPLFDFFRITEGSDTRILENGDFRYIE